MIKVEACMKRNVVSVSRSSTVLDAVRTVIVSHIGTLPVVDEAGVLVGLATVQDLIKLFLPDFVSLIADFEFVHDFGPIELQRLEDQPEIAAMPITKIMGEPISVKTDARLLRTMSLMQKHDMRDMPVVDVGSRLVGIASHVDLASAFFKLWIGEEPAACS